MAFRRFRGGLVFLLLLPLTAAADTVHVFMERNLNGTISRTGDVTVDTLTSYTPASPVQVSGYIFTGWTISTVQDFVSRDHYGRSLETVAVTVYEATTLTANYLPSGFDEDADGLADGWELYWFGNLDQGAADDSDGDGYTQVVEFALGTNPHLRNRKLHTGIISDVGQTVTYNPDGIAMLTIRSEPEGKLFATTREYVRQGAVRNTAAYNPNNSSFSYWMVNGERQADARGRAIDSLSVTMPPYDLELVAVSKDDVIERKIGYWYGIDTALDSDTDGDGYTLAVELALGTNPLLPNRKLREGVLSGQGEIVQYNPDCISRYTIRSEPEGRLFATRTDFAKAGTPLSTPTCNPDTTTFAYWAFNGVRQADHRGRALDSVSFAMPAAEVELVAVCIDKTEDRKIAYWYGDETTLDSDTDGDGYTLAVELALGTNPLVANRKSRQGIISAAGETRELNLQVYEQVRGTLVGDAFADLFTSPIAGTEGTVFFDGTPIWPIVADLNNDGLFDIVIESVDSSARIVYLNVGVVAGPEFEVRPWRDEWEPLVMANRHASTDATLDTPIVNGLSCTHGDADRDGVADLLASDVDGRIWYYRGEGVSPSQSGAAETAPPQVSYQLQHKVWGGSYAGFANGLRIAAVDWDDDGDLDCLCGTAEGKLMLLRDPKVGRPTNLKALVGVDNVKLDWDPNQQSRIRGYKVYRADAGADEFASLVSPYTPLPTYRDYPPSVSDFDYKVSSVSRHYVAGNSTPIESESPATEAVRASLGKVKFFWNDVAVKQGERAEVLLSIENSLNYDVAGKTQVVTYDPAYLTPLKIVKTGLTENVIYEELVADGKWTISLKSGKLEAGGGKFLTLVFDTLKLGTTRVGEATVTIVPRQEPAPYRLGDVTGDGVVDTLDLRELAKLKSAVGRKWTANQLKAGDFNGNGLLDNADYQALRAMLKERGML